MPPLSPVLVRFLACLALAILALAAVIWLRRAALGGRYALWIALAALALQLAGAVALYACWPGVAEFSDAVLYYWPQGKSVLAGQVPYRDFPTSYSLLFPVLMAGAIKVWPSYGSIVAVMVLFGCATMALYLRATRSPQAGTAAAFCVLSPVWVYWVAATGYNSVMIAPFAMAGLLAASRNRVVVAAALIVVGLLFTKLLMLLALPAIILVQPRRAVMGAAVSAGMVALALGLPMLAGINSLMPAELEIERAGSGNLWFVLGPFVPRHMQENGLYIGLSPAALGLVVAGMALAFYGARRRAAGSGDIAGSFDAGAAFFAATVLAFMILARKSHTPYLCMAWTFVAHAVLACGLSPARTRLALALLTFLGATTYVKHPLSAWEYRYNMDFGASPWVAVGWCVDLLMVVSYCLLWWLCMGVAMRGGAGSRQA